MPGRPPWTRETALDSRETLAGEHEARTAEHEHEADEILAAADARDRVAAGR